LNVTSQSAAPLTAVSSTISSAGSFNCGRHKNRRGTGIDTCTKASSTSFTCRAVRPLASRCSGRVRTASYSMINGAEASTSNLRSRAAFNNCLEAPRSLRKAATTTSVSRISRSRCLHRYDITCDSTPSSSRGEMLRCWPSSVRSSRKGSQAELAVQRYPTLRGSERDSRRCCNRFQWAVIHPEEYA
jgi:hypothetical protein